MRWILGLVLNAALLLLLSSFLSGFYLSGFVAALIASLILSIVNTIVKPVLVVLTLPITFLTLGLFLFVINGLTLMLTSALMGSSFAIDGIAVAILAAIVISLGQTFIINPIKRG